MSEQWVTARIKQKGEIRCIHWKSLRDQILAHPDTKKKINVFALSIYGLVIFPKALGHIDEAVTDLFDQLKRRVTPVDKISYQVFLENYSPLKELAATSRRDDITGERWMTIIQNLQDENVEWRAPWMVPDEILYRCEDFDWVPLLGIWGAVGYTPLLVGKIQEMSNAWKQIHIMKRITVGATVTPEYHGWQSKKINDNISRTREERVRSIEEHL
ncbi:hypothetical protein Goari_005504 [Gossypium aridum]|uniref:DUF7745 domain-containing protein n=1 Tax=Gossypium aridum TaxID=34290 RepID=A0A7J8YMZ8_GOSAI|nr:hypothetical protein [Gossypium aridum]